jgi:hypothetical protein
MVEHNNVEGRWDILDEEGFILDVDSKLLLEGIVDIDASFHAVFATGIIPVGLECDRDAFPLP